MNSGTILQQRVEKALYAKYGEEKVKSIVAIDPFTNKENSLMRIVGKFIQAEYDHKVIPDTTGEVEFTPTQAVTIWLEERDIYL